MQNQNQRNEIMQLLLSATVFLVVLGLILWMVAGATIAAWLKVITTNLPWIIGGVLGIVLAVPAGKLIIKGAIFLHYYRQALRDARFIRIVPANDTHFDQEQVLTFTRAFGGMVREWRLKWNKGEPWFRLRFYEDDKGQISVFMGFPQDKENGVYDSIKAIYP